jgi:peptide chain release factor 1
VVFDLEILEDKKGVIVLRAVGAGAVAMFRDEPGGHRWQRVPPNERRGRVQTSTITVAVLAEPAEAEVRVEERDLVWVMTMGTGPGGQKRNKTASVVLLTHKPSGVQVRCESTRSQSHNRALALALLRARLWAAAQGRLDEARAEDRRRQVGSGMRGDKRRTIRVQDDTVVDHRTGRRWSFREYVRGQW